jgi:HNH endonuclease
VFPAHHLEAVSEGGAFWDPDNLIVLCVPCHNAVDAERRRASRDRSGSVQVDGSSSYEARPYEPPTIA